MSDQPSDVRAAPSHLNPYPYYARLVERSLYREDSSGAWVAVSAAAVEAVLTSPLCLTRPAGAVVPGVMAGTAVAEIFQGLVRMAEGEAHCPIKSTIRVAVDALDLKRVTDLTHQHATKLASSIEPERSCDRLTQFMYALPVDVITDLLGVPSDRVPDVARWMGEYGVAAAAAVTGSPPCTPALMTAGSEAARQLLSLFRALQRSHQEKDGSLFPWMVREATRAGRPDLQSVTINAIGLMSQGFAATSSLIGATLLALGRQAEAVAAIRRGDHPILGPLMQEVLRCDPFTQSLPRFVSRDAIVAGQQMRQGDLVIAVIAAANRDPALNSDPDRFDIVRPARRYLEFGAGIHACPGGHIATAIAHTGVQCLLERGVQVAPLRTQISYRPSAHLRMPVFK